MSSDVAKALRDRRMAAWNEMRAIAEGAADGSRPFTDAELVKWTGLNAQLDALDRRLKALLDTEKRNRELRAALRREAEAHRGYSLRARRLTARELGC